MAQKLLKSSTDKALYGVCGGIGKSLGISSFVVRVVFLFTTPGSAFLYAYLVGTLDSEPSLDNNF